MKVKITGDAFVLSTNVTVAEMKDLMHFAKDSLVLRDEKKEPIFKISLGDNAHISNNGVVFTSVGADERIESTFLMPSGLNLEEKRDYVRQNFGIALMNLKKLEDQIRTEALTVTTLIASIDEVIE
jgi:hypothetical protein